MAIGRNDFEAIAHGYREHLAEVKAQMADQRITTEAGVVALQTIRDNAARMAAVLKGRNSSFQPDRFLGHVNREP